ncbi:MAG: ATP-binding protein [Salinivirgaceae bacterium]
MNSIIGFSELLRNTNQPLEKQKQYFDLIYKSSNQLLNIINNILDVSKLEVGQAKIVEKEFDVNQIILDSLQSVMHLISDNNEVILKTQLPLVGNDSYIWCDGSRLQQVITNLIQNAIKFTNHGTIITGYELVENKLQFFVKDTGIGISTEKHHLVFERFGQAEEGYARNFEGAGLGLPICKGFVELMGGSIWLESEKGVGSNFYFEIPYKQAAPKIGVASSMPEHLDYNWAGKKILLVEDESMSQNFIETIILPFGAKIIYAGDGFDALNKVRLNPDIDLILMDIRLPRLDGIEAAKKVRLLGFNKPIIAQTANALNEDRKLCREAGCTNFIPKPINRIDLLKMLDDYLK